MREVYEKDINNIFIGVVHITEDSEMPANCVKVRPPDGLQRAKWNDNEWIEDMTQEEIDALNNLSSESSFEETQLEYNIDLDYRLSLIEMGL